LVSREKAVSLLAKCCMTHDWLTWAFVLIASSLP
jgi:hypothetical protein